ncbi:MAG: tetratricopeptide repeat protein [Luteolibacter sp.]|uniref:tetratricopeptide repeat protein n=1 Tax=Luteolibacter sp. TaxID=1962973 RepID=UPI0032640122
MSADLKESPVPLAEISQGPNAFEAFLDRNQKGIAAFALLLALGAIALVVQRGMETNRQEDAGAALVKAEDLASLQAVVVGHKDTQAAGSAMVLLANSQWTAGKQDEAIGTLRKFIESNPDHPAVPTAKASLGAKLMAQGKSGDASKVFDELVSDPASAYIAPFALVSLGDIAKAEGDLTKAEASYVKVKNDFPDSNFSETAGRRIAILKAKPPVEIAPPPAPPAPPASSTPGAESSPSLTPPPGITLTPGIANPGLEIPADPPSQEGTPAPGIEIQEEPAAPEKP